MMAGVATAGIAWGAMAADQLKLPFIYVRPKPKEHGLGNQIEGFYEKGQKVVVIEDLVSTGKSSLQVVDVLKNAGAILPRRDAVDERIMNEVRTGTGHIIKWVKDVGGWPEFESAASGQKP